MGHEATHVSDLGRARAPDREIAERARTSNAVLVSLDLHHQEAEWLAIHAAIAEAGVQLVRVRLPHNPGAGELPLLIAQHLLHAMGAWLLELQHGAGLVVVGPPPNRVRALSPEAVLRLLTERRERPNPNTER